MNSYAAFDGPRLIHSGPLAGVLAALKPRFDRDPGAVVLVFDNETGRQVDFDLRGTLDEVIARAQPPRPGPGRPKLGVVAREVSLLPRHWEWLEQQPSGASAALRRLVDEARKHDAGDRPALEATGRFLAAIAANLPGYEEATRALWAREKDRFRALIAEWPTDIREHALQILG